jgi:Cof subfamily protein (haloacid dehalogenase superfamily)
MSRLLLFDVDGTLAHPGQMPPASTVEAIHKARAKGHKVFLSTGRARDAVPADVAVIGFDGGIFNSGGVVMIGDEIVAQHFMPEPEVTQILRFLQEHSIFATLETPDGTINCGSRSALLAQIDPTGVSEEMMAFTRGIIMAPQNLPFSCYHGQPVYKIAYFSTDPAINDRMIRELSHIMAIVPYHNIIQFPLTTGEILDPTITKGRAMIDLCKLLEIDPSACVAFGDSMNDAEILQAAGIGVAMGNAAEELKALADITCDRCENDGIAKVMAELGLI